MFKRLFWVFLVAALLAACSGEQSQTTPTWTLVPTQAQNQAQAQGQSAAQENTATVAPASATPSATSTPAATNTPKPTFTPSPTQPTATPTSDLIGPANFPAENNPLTGLPAADPALLNRRPIAIKVNLVPRNYYRPPWGLSLADIVFDYYHNDGYSRLHAIFYGNDAAMVGPIRSGRMPDGDLVRMYKSIFAYGSADSRINSRFFNSDYADRLILERGADPCPPTVEKPMCRFEPAGYNHLVAGTKELSQYMTDKKVDNSRPNLSGMTFQTVPPQGGSANQQVIVHYSIDNYASWQYDAATGVYLRFQDKVMAQSGQEEYEPLTDRLNDQQISARNVVVILAPHTYYTPPPGEIVEITLEGSGKAYAYRDGLMYEVAWNRPAYDSVLYLTFPDGSAYPFKPGNTWFQIVNDLAKISQPDAATWRFDFFIP